MHTYANLCEAAADTWAQECANRTALLHVVRNGPRALLGILRNGSLSPDSPGKMEATKRSEAELDEPRAVYFYAGRAYPNSAGEATFWLSPGDDASLNGKASPFDSGGVIHGWSKLPWAGMGAASPAEYVETHSVDLSFFHEYFGHHLTAFFGSPPQYWDDAPAKPIDGISFGPTSDFRDWTFEVRVHGEVSIREHEVVPYEQPQ